jgi:hypothetical protein
LDVLDMGEQADVVFLVGIISRASSKGREKD